MKKELITASRMAAFCGCPRRHYYAYELGIRRTEEGEALRIGTAIHAALEARAKGLEACKAYEAALATGAFDEQQAAVLCGLVMGYYNRYGVEDEFKMQAEVSFEERIAGSGRFNAAGKIDGLAQWPDGTTALVEHKTCGEDISPTADYWARLRYNPQLMQYVIAARSAGWKLERGVVYDVIRKPAIRVKQGETSAAFADRLFEDTKTRKEFYFARQSLDIPEYQIEDFKAQRLAVCRSILAHRRMKGTPPEVNWPRNVNGVTCRACEFASFCLGAGHVDAQNVPAGFEVAPVNQELVK